MLNKKTLFLGISAVFTVVSPLIAMEEDEGRNLKRTYDQISYEKKYEQKEVFSKKVKLDDDVECVLFNLSDDKEFKLTKELASLSSTLREAMKMSSDEDENNTIIRVSLTDIETLTKKRFKIIKKLLHCILLVEQGNKIDNVYLKTILQEFASDSDESNALNGIVRFFDLGEQLTNLIEASNIDLWFFVAENGKKISITSDVLLKCYYFKNMHASNLSESRTHTINTLLSCDDLNLIITLMNEFTAYQTEIFEIMRVLNNNQFEEQRKADFKSQICKLESNLVQRIEERICNLFNNDLHSINALIQQTHQWELVYIKKALIKYLADNTPQETIEELLQVLPVSLSKDFFSIEVIDQTNAVKLFNIFLKRFMAALYNRHNNATIEKEKEKEVDVHELNVTLEDIAAESFHAFKSFIELNTDCAIGLAKQNSLQLNDILGKYELIIATLEQLNPQIAVPFEEFLKSVLVFNLPVTKCRDYAMKKTVQKVTARSFQGIASNNRYLETFRVESEDKTILSIKNYFHENQSKSFQLQGLLPNSLIFIYDNCSFVKIGTDFVRFDIGDSRVILQKIAIGNGTPIVLNKDLFCVQHPTQSIAVLADFASKKRLKTFNFDSKITKALLFNETRTIIFIFENNKVVSWNLENDESKNFSVEDRGDVTSAVTLNENKFILGYSTGRLCIFDRTTGFEKELRFEDKFPGVSDVDFSSVIALYNCQDGKHFVTVCKKKTMPENKYEIWDGQTGERKFESIYEHTSLLVGVQNGYLITKNMMNLEFYFMPVLVSCKEIIMHMRKNNKQF